MNSVMKDALDKETDGIYVGERTFSHYMLQAGHLARRLSIGQRVGKVVLGMRA